MSDPAAAALLYAILSLALPPVILLAGLLAYRWLYSRRNPPDYR